MATPFVIQEENPLQWPENDFLALEHAIMNDIQDIDDVDDFLDVDIIGNNVLALLRPEYGINFVTIKYQRKKT